MFKYPFPRWDTCAWCIVLGLAALLEALGLTRPGDATLTQLIRSTVPMWARAAILGWLAYHFLIATGK